MSAKFPRGGGSIDPLASSLYITSSQFTFAFCQPHLVQKQLAKKSTIKLVYGTPKLSDGKE